MLGAGSGDTKPRFHLHSPPRSFGSRRRADGPSRAGAPADLELELRAGRRSVGRPVDRGKWARPGRLDFSSAPAPPADVGPCRPLVLANAAEGTNLAGIVGSGSWGAPDPSGRPDGRVVTQGVTRFRSFLWTTSAKWLRPRRDSNPRPQD